MRKNNLNRWLGAAVLFAALGALLAGCSEEKAPEAPPPPPAGANGPQAAPAGNTGGDSGSKPMQPNS